MAKGKAVRMGFPDNQNAYSQYFYVNLKSLFKNIH